MDIANVVIKLIYETDEKSKKDAEKQLDKEGKEQEKNAEKRKKKKKEEQKEEGEGILELVKAFKGLAAVQIAAFGIKVAKQVIEYTDGVTLATREIYNMSESLEEFNEIQNAAYEAANSVYAKYSDISGVLATMVKSNFFSSTDEAEEYIEQLYKILKLGGATSAQASTMAGQVAESMWQQTTVSSSTIDYFTRADSRVFKALADELGISYDENDSASRAVLQSYIDSNRITSKMLYNEIMSFEDEKNKLAESNSITLAEEMTTLQNEASALVSKNGGFDWSGALESGWESVSDQALGGKSLEVNIVKNLFDKEKRENGTVFSDAWETTVEKNFSWKNLKDTVLTAMSPVMTFFENLLEGGIGTAKEKSEAKESVYSSSNYDYSTSNSNSSNNYDYSTKNDNSSSNYDYSTSNSNSSNNYDYSSNGVSNNTYSEQNTENSYANNYDYSTVPQSKTYNYSTQYSQPYSSNTYNINQSNSYTLNSKDELDKAVKSSEDQLSTIIEAGS